jgi:hypothetical protein
LASENGADITSIHNDINRLKNPAICLTVRGDGLTASVKIREERGIQMMGFKTYAVMPWIFRLRF